MASKETETESGPPTAHDIMGREILDEECDPTLLDKHVEDHAKTFLIEFENCWGIKKEGNLQDAFENYKKLKQKEIKKAKRKRKDVPNEVRLRAMADPDHMWQLRMKFLEQAKKYFGVPYSKKYWKPQDAEYQSPLFLDCCGLVRRMMRDLRHDFGFRMGPWNQCYMHDTLPVVVQKEEDMKPGDLVFISAIYHNKKLKKQKHNLTHVEIWLGDGPKTIGARWQKGKVQIFDSYAFKATSYHSEKYIFKSIDTWLMGICRSHCPEHVWRTRGETYKPTKKSVFRVPDKNQHLNDSEPGEKASDSSSDDELNPASPADQSKENQPVPTQPKTSAAKTASGSATKRRVPKKGSKSAPVRSRSDLSLRNRGNISKSAGIKRQPKECPDSVDVPVREDSAWDLKEQSVPLPSSDNNLSPTEQVDVEEQRMLHTDDTCISEGTTLEALSNLSLDIPSDLGQSDSDSDSDEDSDEGEEVEVGRSEEFSKVIREVFNAEGSFYRADGDDDEIRHSSSDNESDDDDDYDGANEEPASPSFRKHYYDQDQNRSGDLRDDVTERQTSAIKHSQSDLSVSSDEDEFQAISTTHANQPKEPAEIHVRSKSEISVKNTSLTKEVDQKVRTTLLPWEKFTSSASVADSSGAVGNLSNDIGGD